MAKVNSNSLFIKPFAFENKGILSITILTKNEVICPCDQMFAFKIADEIPNFPTLLKVAFNALTNIAITKRAKV